MKTEKVGFPEFWESVPDQYPEAFNAIHDLMPLQKAIFLKPIREPLHKAIRHLSKITVNSLGALTTLLPRRLRESVRLCSDKIVPIRNAILNTIKAVEAEGNNPIFTVLPGCDQNISDVYERPELSEWFLKYRREH